MARSAEAARRIRARQQRRRRNPTGFDFSWQMWENCELCGKPYCCNNYPDHKPRRIRWRGYIICATCRYNVVPIVRKLIDEKVLKERKKGGTKKDR